MFCSEHDIIMVDPYIVMSADVSAAILNLCPRYFLENINSISSPHFTLDMHVEINIAVC